MSSIVEGTIEALVEFESALDGIRSDSAEAKKQMVKSAVDLAASAKAKALARANEISSQRLEAARREAEGEAREIRAKGTAEMKRFEDSISKRRRDAAELVTKRLLGES